MERGDISNEISPRLVIVYENLLGLLPTKAHQAKAASYVKFHRWKRAVNVFETNDILARRLWDVTFRLRFQVEVLTYLDEQAVEHIQKRMDDEDMPVSRVWFMQPHVLSRELAYMPQVAAIYDPNPAHQFTYGSRGRIISPANPQLIGSF